MPVLKEKYGVDTIEIFGSYVHAEQTRKSDLDILITFSKPYNLWELIDEMKRSRVSLHRT